MTNKKTKLTISGSSKKPISSIELAKSKSKNSVIIEKKTSRFSSKGSFKKSSFNKSENFKKGSFTRPKVGNFSKPIFPTRNDNERRKLAEQRATKRLKDDLSHKEDKRKSGSKRRELKLTISRALSDTIETKTRSLAAIKRAKLKENRDQKKDQINDSFKPVKREVHIPEVITIRELANRMAEQSSNIIKHLLGMGVTATINHSIDTDTAEYLVKEFGHTPIREKKSWRNNK